MHPTVLSVGPFSITLLGVFSAIGILVVRSVGVLLVVTLQALLLYPSWLWCRWWYQERPPIGQQCLIEIQGGGSDHLFVILQQLPYPGSLLGLSRLSQQLYLSHQQARQYPQLH